MKTWLVQFFTRGKEFVGAASKVYIRTGPPSVSRSVCYGNDVPDLEIKLGVCNASKEARVFSLAESNQAKAMF
jgi:hypothetical protein